VSPVRAEDLRQTVQSRRRLGQELGQARQRVFIVNLHEPIKFLVKAEDDALDVAAHRSIGELPNQRNRPMAQCVCSGGEHSQFLRPTHTAELVCLPARRSRTERPRKGAALRSKHQRRARPKAPCLASRASQRCQRLADSLRMNTEQRPLTVAEFAAKRGCSGQHVRDLIAAGRLRAIDIGRGSRPIYRIPADEAERALNRPAFSSGSGRRRRDAPRRPGAALRDSGSPMRLQGTAPEAAHASAIPTSAASGVGQRGLAKSWSGQPGGGRAARARERQRKGAGVLACRGVSLAADAASADLVRKRGLEPPPGCPD
jgi:hypothetical protein